MREIYFQEILRITFSNVDVKCRPRTDYSTVFKTLGGDHPAEVDVEISVNEQMWTQIHL